MFDILIRSFLALDIFNMGWVGGCTGGWCGVCVLGVVVVVVGGVWCVCVYICVCECVCLCVCRVGGWVGGWGVEGGEVCVWWMGGVCVCMCFLSLYIHIYLYIYDKYMHVSFGDKLKMLKRP